MANINLNLSEEEVKGILNVLGELPSKTGAYMLIVKIDSQLKQQTGELVAPPQAPVAEEAVATH